MKGLSGRTMVQAVVHHLAKGLFAIGLLIVLFVGIRRIRRYNRLIDSIYADNDDKRLYGITTILLLMVLTGILSFAVNAVGRFVFLSSEIPFVVLACFFSGLLYMLCYRGFVQHFSFTDIAREECEETTETAPQEGYSYLLQKIDDERLYLQDGERRDRNARCRVHQPQAHSLREKTGKRTPRVAERRSGRASRLHIHALLLPQLPSL